MEVALGVPRGVAVIVALAFGLLIGSFLNVVIHRLPRGESIVHPPSHCPGCETPVRWYDNIPLLSYLWLRGRCRGCGAPISLRYPGVELLTGIVFALVAWRYGVDPMTVLGCAFAAALVATAFIDFDHQIIPDEISLGGLALALVVAPGVAWISGEAFASAFAQSAIGALLGGGLLWIVAFVHARVCSGLGRRFPHWPDPDEDFPKPNTLDYWTWFPGLGFGDVKLLAMIGAVLGPWGVLQTIIAASAAGLVIGVAGMVLWRRSDTPFGFAPAIALGALLALLAPESFAAFPRIG